MKWIDAEQATARMGTQRQTLYANVSRGRIRARPDPADPRKRLYAEDDIQRLASRRRGRPAAETLAAQTIRWGEPVLPSAVSTVIGGRLYYRGVDAADLAVSARLEDVAALLWQLANVDLGTSGVQGGTLAEAMQMLAQHAVSDPPTLGRANLTLRNEAVEVFQRVSNCLAGGGDGELAHRLAATWGRPDAETAIGVALVLLADHELNASTFAARVTASTGASLSACVLSGLCTLSGPLHGGVAAAIAALRHNASRTGAENAALNWLAQGQALPAFGHQLYPQGDIRASVLMQTFDLTSDMSRLRDAGEELSGEKANVDFALCALNERFDLPDDATLILFALARSVGWLAHALEQIETGTLIRPRARFVGPAVGG